MTGGMSCSANRSQRTDGRDPSGLNLFYGKELIYYYYYY